MNKALIIIFQLLSMQLALGQDGLGIDEQLQNKIESAEGYLSKGNIIQAIEISVELEALVDHVSDIDAKIKTYLTIASIHGKAASYEESEKYLQKAKSLVPSPDLNNYGLDIIIIRTTSKVQQGALDEVLSNIQISYPKAQAANDTLRLIKIESQLAIYHFQKNNFDSLLLSTNKIINLAKSAKEYLSLSNAIQNKVLALINLNQMDSVMAYMIESIEYARQYNSPELEIEGIFLIGDYYYRNGQYEQALVYLDSASSMVKNKGLMETEKFIAEVYFNVYNEVGNYKEALEWQQTKQSLYDSLHNKNSDIKVALAESKYKLQQQQTELLLEESKNAKNRFFIATLTFGILLLAIIFIYQFRSLKSRKRAAILLKEKNDEISAQNEELRQQQDSLVQQNKFIEDQSTRTHFYLTQLEKLTSAYKLNKGEKNKSLKEICELAQRCLNVSRVSIWAYDKEKEAIESKLLLNNGEFDMSTMVLFGKDYPKYFAKIKENILVVADNAIEDPFTSEFAKGYLDVHDIKSMIDAPFIFNGEFAGVICCEHQSEFRHWQNEDSIFLKALGDFISITLLTEQHQIDNDRLKEINESLEETIHARTETLEKQNKQLTEYAFINSHLLRAPLARLLGLSFLLSKEATSVKDLELIDSLTKSAQELDELVKKISELLYDGNDLSREDINEIIERNLNQQETLP